MRNTHHSLHHPLPRFIAVSMAMALCFTLLAGGPAFAEETGKEQLRAFSQAFREVVKDVSPAVVYISTEQKVRGQANVPEQFRDFFGEEFGRRFFGIPEDREYTRQGLGSGFITNTEGYILTNSHVVAEADKIRVTLSDRREFDAKIVGTDPKTDVAVIKIEGEDLPFVALGDSEAIEVGDWAIAVGNPFGFSQSVTAGIISAEGRSNIGINDYEDFIQTDAAINPGNSGGPLVNIDGEVIGINTAIFSRSGGYQGIGFAIPINMAKNIMESLITEGKVVRGWLGVLIQEVTSDIAESFGLEETGGALVSKVVEDSPAEKAGIERGDVIIGYNGQEIDTISKLRNLVAQTPVGEEASVTVIRNGEEHTLTVKIGELDGDVQASADEVSPGEFGLTVQELTPEIAEQLGYRNERGVLVSEVEPGSPAAQAGLRRGDLIQEVNRQSVTSLSDYNEAMSGIADDESFLLLVRRGENTIYIVVNAD